jgi:hypothetical protein
MIRRLMVLGTALLSLCSCAPSGTGFLCGVGLDEDPDVIRRCDRPHEVCVCATNSCARRVEVTEECTSGLMYVDVPFAADDLPGKCADEKHQGWIIAEDATVFACGATPPDSTPEPLGNPDRRSP